MGLKRPEIKSPDLEHSSLYIPAAQRSQSVCRSLLRNLTDRTKVVNELSSMGDLQEPEMIQRQTYHQSVLQHG